MQEEPQRHGYRRHDVNELKAIVNLVEKTIQKHAETSHKKLYSFILSSATRISSDKIYFSNPNNGNRQEGQ